MMFARILKIELHKAFENKWFLISLFVGCLLAAGSAVTAFNLSSRMEPFITSIQFLSKKFIPPSTQSVFSYWMVDLTAEPFVDLYFLLLPLLAVIPYSWSLLSERTSGYANQIIARSKRTKYFAAKHFASFIVGGSVIAIPVVLNFLVCLCFAPICTPDVTGVTVFGVFEESLWSYFFYNTPVIYCLLRTVLLFVFSGLWASLVMALSFLISKRIPLMVVPYLSLILLKFFNERITAPLLHFEQDITPFGFLRSVPPAYFTSCWVIAVEIGILFVVVSIFIFKNRKVDLL